MSQFTLYRANSVRNKYGKPAYVAAPESATYGAVYLTDAAIAAHFEGDADGVDFSDFETGWKAVYNCGLASSNELGGIAFESEADAVAAARSAVEYWGYVIEDRAEADRLSTEHAEERTREKEGRQQLRKRLNEAAAVAGGIVELAKRVGLKPNHVSNLAKFMSGKKPDVPGESLTRIAEKLDE